MPESSPKIEKISDQNPQYHYDDHSSFQKEKWFSDEFLYKLKGFWLWLPYLEPTDRVVKTFKPLPTDVILASFPKTGTTWLKALLHSIIFRDSKENSLVSNHPHELVPSLETKLFVGKTSDDRQFSAEKVRILGTHIPYQIIGDALSSSECKVVYVTRNPKDSLISLWHFVQKGNKFEEDPWTLEAAVHQFCNGVLPFGPYYDHVLAYREESLKKPGKVFFVTFEELKEDGNTHVGRLAEFLGCPFEGKNKEAEIEDIVKRCSFEILSNHEINKSSEVPECFPLPYNSFFRNGKVGDHTNYLNPEMIQKIDAITREKFHNSGFDYGQPTSVGMAMFSVQRGKMEIISNLVDATNWFRRHYKNHDPFFPVDEVSAESNSTIYTCFPKTGSISSFFKHKYGVQPLGLVDGALHRPLPALSRFSSRLPVSSNATQASSSTSFSGAQETLPLGLFSPLIPVAFENIKSYPELYPGKTSHEGTGSIGFPFSSGFFYITLNALMFMLSLYIVTHVAWSKLSGGPKAISLKSLLLLAFLIFTLKP